jgi:hypothetical protein
MNLTSFVYRKVTAYDRYKRQVYPLTVIKTIPEYNKVYNDLVSRNLHIITYTYYPNGNICKSERFIVDNTAPSDLPNFNSPEAFFCEPD